MDPKQLAEEIIDSLFADEVDPRENIEETEEEYYDDDEDLQEEEDKEEDEDESEDEEEDESEEEDYEDEGDEDEGEEEDSAPAPAKAAAPQSNLGATLSMKPSMASPSLPSATSVGGEVADATGKGANDVNGKGDTLGTKQTVGYAPGQAAGTLNMKPSAAASQIPVFGPVMNQEELQRDVRAMFGGSEDLSEEFVSKAASLYEAAVVTKVQQIAGALRTELAEQFQNKVLEVKETLEEQLDTYLNYVVEEWIKENQLAVDNGLRTEIAENFIRGLKTLFTESYIEVPEDKANAFDELSEAVSHLENRLNEEIETNAHLITKIKSLKAQQIFQEQTSHLTSLEAEQIRPLVENVSFENEQDFTQKVQVLVEGVVSSNKPKKVLKESKKEQKALFERVVLDEETEQEEIQSLSPAMEVYSRAIERSLQN